MDLVATCPSWFWREWIAEGDAAGDPETGQEWDWYTRHRLAPFVMLGDRLYIVAYGKLRGYAPVTRLAVYGNPRLPKHVAPDAQWGIVRQGGAVAVTILEPIRGFQGLRQRWWKRGDELPFPDWKTP